MTVRINYSRDSVFDNMTLTLLKDYYMQSHEVSPQDAFARTATAFCGGDMSLAQRIYDAASKQWFSFSSPILSNAPTTTWDGTTASYPDGVSRAMPISCFLSMVPDTIKGQMDASVELAALSVSGGGVGQHFMMRGVTDKSPGAIPYLKTSDSNIMYYKQGKTRKGSVAAYLNVSHPDIQEFVNVRVPTGGDINRKCLNVHNAVNLSDEFLTAVANGDEFVLRCPHTNEVVDVVNAADLFYEMLETRFRTGEPYLNYLDEARRKFPEVLRKQGFEVNGSNLCNEIHLATDERHTAVCCLSSLNLEHYDEWKDTNLVADLITMLDNVLTFFIEHAPEETEKAVRSAKGFRDLGLGVMGFHSYLQRKGVSFESEEALRINEAQMRHIHQEGVQQSETLAGERGEPEYMRGTGRRNAHLFAVAPTANSSIIAGCSPSIEPWNANAYTHRTRVGSHLIKNEYLEELIDDRGDPSDWDIIVHDAGSVRSLPYLSKLEKDVYKTVWEIDQRWVVRHARIRQQFIDQGQSVNLFFPNDADKSYVVDVHLMAFAKNIEGDPLKGLYYLNTNRGRVIEQVGKGVVRDALKDFATQEVEDEECVACSV